MILQPPGTITTTLLSERRQTKTSQSGQTDTERQLLMWFSSWICIPITVTRLRWLILLNATMANKGRSKAYIYKFRIKSINYRRYSSKSDFFRSNRIFFVSAKTLILLDFGHVLIVHSFRGPNLWWHRVGLFRSVRWRWKMHHRPSLGGQIWLLPKFGSVNESWIHRSGANRGAQIWPSKVGWCYESTNFWRKHCWNYPLAIIESG